MCQVNERNYINSIVPHNTKVNHKAAVNFNKVIFQKGKQTILILCFNSIKIQIYGESKREKENASFPYLFCG